MSDLTPKRVATAIGVSESSLKRWCDRGLIETTLTAGGHRRLALRSVLEFLRQSQHPVVRPELLGLPPVAGSGERSTKRAREEFLTALLAGDEASCRRILFNLHLAGQSISSIGDEVIARVYEQVGDKWQNHEIDVYQERRGCEYCVRSLHELRQAIPLPATDAALAIGGTPEWDPYQLPTTLVDLVLYQNGWRTQSLGSQLPFASLAKAIDELRPRLFWLSVSAIGDESSFLRGYREFFEQVHGQTAIVVGGRAMREELRRQIQYSAYCDTLRHLEEFAKTLLPKSKRARSR